MRFNSPAFLAWQEAEHLASEAERKVFVKLCNAGAVHPTKDELKIARALRENASRLMKQMLDQLRVLADSLKCTVEPGGPVGFGAPQEPLPPRTHCPGSQPGEHGPGSRS